MSLRRIAKKPGIASIHLSLLLNVLRAWLGNVKESYLGLVNTFVNTQEAKKQSLMDLIGIRI